MQKTVQLASALLVAAAFVSMAMVSPPDARLSASEMEAVGGNGQAKQCPATPCITAAPGQGNGSQDCKAANAACTTCATAKGGEDTYIPFQNNCNGAPFNGNSNNTDCNGNIGPGTCQANPNGGFNCVNVVAGNNACLPVNVVILIPIAQAVKTSPVTATTD